jgi:c-di-GMP-binding flagellar brake protein YcgR
MERRRYTRLDSVFPVKFRVTGPSGETRSAWIQGFTHNVSTGGILLDVETVDPDAFMSLQRPDARLSLEISMPLYRPPVIAAGKVAWVKEGPGEKYSLGVNYESIDPAGRKRIMRYVRAKKSFPPFAVSVVFSCPPSSAITVTSITSS